MRVGESVTLETALKVCARTMGAALGTGARPALLRRQACGAVRCWTACATARGCHSKPGPARPVPLKKRGYDVTRNPHLNKLVLAWGEGVSVVMSREPVGIPPLPLEQHCLGTATTALHFHLEATPWLSIWPTSALKSPEKA
ncbi:hypothetical protein MC885_014477 [Smutsia gigantea]|nr:hypothetical protein MC885_014477 [Smutsia gigantea]